MTAVQPCGVHLERKPSPTTGLTMSCNQSSFSRLNMLKKLMLALLLISPLSFADWDDVYYCQMTSRTHTETSGKTSNYPLEKFTFKLDKTLNAMVYGGNGFLGNTVDYVHIYDSSPSVETWKAGQRYSMTRFYQGTFQTTLNSPLGITAISADCEKF